MSDIQTIESKIRVSPDIFYPVHNSKASDIILQGGTYSGKTVNTLISLAVKASEQENLRITVTSMSLPHLKGGAIADFEMFIKPYFEHCIVNTNKSENKYTFAKGSYIQFKAFDTESKARGAKRDILYVNEANFVDYPIFWQLRRRTEIQTIIDYNPTNEFWAHSKLKGRKGVEFYISDHTHNPFLSESKHREIENIEDPELWKVYARGMTGDTQGLVYPNWKQIPDKMFFDIVNSKDDAGNTYSSIYGIDYGYTIDPTAGVRVWRIGKNIYIQELFYETALSPTLIKESLKNNGHGDQSGHLYSEHDPDIVARLRSIGVLAIPALKSIKDGIDTLKQYNVFYPESSKNLHKERMSYSWQLDPKTGQPTQKPVDKNNHLMDAARYAVYTHYFRKPEK